MQRGSNLLRLADFNQAVVLETVRRSPGISRAELGRASGLSAQTVSNIARRLIDERLVREGPPVDVVRGRPSIPLLIDGDGSFSIGVHVDPALLTVVLVDLAGQVRASVQVHTPKAHEPQQVIALLAESALGLVADSGVDVSRLLGLGIAAPGPIDVLAGVVLDPPQLMNWRNVHLRADLARVTGLPVLLDKDVTAAATAELRTSGSVSGDFVFLYLGTGVGVGVVMGEQVLRGATNNIGEVGEMIVDPTAEDVGWGRRGGLAAACTPGSLVTQGARAGVLAMPDVTDLAAIDEACTELCALARAGEPAAAAIIDRAAARVAVGLGIVVNLLDVDRVVIGGPHWSRLEHRFLELLPGLLEPELLAATRPIRVDGSALGDQVAARGAAALVMDHFLGPRHSVLVME